MLAGFSELLAGDAHSLLRDRSQIGRDVSAMKSRLAGVNIHPTREYTPANVSCCNRPDAPPFHPTAVLSQERKREHAGVVALNMPPLEASS